MTQAARPSERFKTSWLAARGTVRQISRDRLTTGAAALTYYAILSIFPGLLVLVSVLRLTGGSTTRKVLDGITGMAPGPARSVLSAAILNLQQGAASTAGVLAVVGVLGALWSASGYISAFMQAANDIHDVPEARPFLKKVLTRLGLTVLAGVIIGGAALATVLTGTLARSLGSALGVGRTATAVWDIAKWPVVIILIGLLFAVLYWAAPSARHGGFRWMTPGSSLAVLAWIVASGLFALYVAAFRSYNKVYGSVAVVIVFLVWLWISNLAILVGAEFDAELRRARAIGADREPDDGPVLTNGGQ